MKTLKFNFILFSLLGILFSTYAQERTQTIKGTVVDQEAQITLPGANIIIIGSDPIIGTITDPEGQFRLEGVPIGRHSIQVSYLGYEPRILNDILISTGKETIIKIELQESLVQVEEVVVKAHNRKDQPLNSMASISARSFSVEETRRYAGGLDDPARMAAGFAGVVASPSFGDNQIVIRGNSPKGLGWRLDGVDIPNPNHFGTLGGSGGGVSILSGQLLSNSDFYTGAFPSEYGNAVSGVFDIKLRTGNNEKYEHAVQVGLQGIDLASEGPFSKNGKASYLFNYRYSLLGLVGSLMYKDEVGGANEFPVYQDLNFKINVPTKKAGTFSLTGISGIGSVKNVPLKDSLDWESDLDLVDEDLETKMGALILTNRYILGSKTYFRNSLIASGNEITNTQSSRIPSPEGIQRQDYMDRTAKFSFNSMANHKFSAKHTNRTGFIFNRLLYDTDLSASKELEGDLDQIVKESGGTNLIQAYTQSKFRLSERFSTNLGLHFQYLTLNDNYSIEPRASIKYKTGRRSSLSLGYGLHSQIEHLGVYMVSVEDESGNTRQANKELEFTKSHHLVLGYDFLITENLRIKLEPYYQYLYDVPVVEGSYESMINSTGGIINNKLVNDGTGYNMGIDLTFERFLKNNYYYLITATLYDSKYKGGDGVERDTRFNGGFAVNGIFGKEFYVGRSGNNILGINGRVYFSGGERHAPLMESESIEQGTSIYDWDRAYEDQVADFFGLDLTFTYRTNKKKYSGIWALQIKNALNSKVPGQAYYDSVKGSIETIPDAGIVPFISYKIEF